MVLQENKQLFENILYQGTPSDFDSLSLDYIGSGAGSCSFGWGLYFTDDPKIAEYYAFHNSKSSQKSSYPKEVTVEFKSGGEISYPYDKDYFKENPAIEEIFSIFYDLYEGRQDNEMTLDIPDIKKQIKEFQDFLNDPENNHYTSDSYNQTVKNVISVLRKAKKITAKFYSHYVYKISLPLKDNITIYNGDVPINEQTLTIQSKFQKMKQWMVATYEREIENFIEKYYYSKQIKNLSGRALSKLELLEETKNWSVKKLQACFDNPMSLYNPSEIELFENSAERPGTALHTYFALANYWTARAVTGKNVDKYNIEALKDMSRLFVKFGIKGVKYKAGQNFKVENPDAYNYVFYTVKGSKVLKKDSLSDYSG
jgi:hypothetical protein